MVAAVDGSSNMSGRAVVARGRSVRRLGLVGAFATLVALAVVVAWQVAAGLDHIDRMMAERSRTLLRMVSTEVRNVARYGSGRLERLDEVLGEVADSSDVEGVLLERSDGEIRLARGRLPDPLPAFEANGEHRVFEDRLLVVSGPVRIETQGCDSCPSCAGAGLACGTGAGIGGDYEVLLVLDAGPYRVLRRTVWLQAGVGGGLLLVLTVGLAWYARRMRRDARVGEVVAAAHERARAAERLGRLAAGLAHEIKNPVGSLRGFAQLIGERADPGSREAEYAGLMVTELDGITRRIDRLRDWAKPSPPLFRPGRPADLVRRVVALLEPDRAARGLTMDLEIPAGPGPGSSFDEDRLRDAVVNLLMNAIEASPNAGTVRVDLRLDERLDRWILDVRDQGPGIPPGERERALRPFHSTKPGGMGLGLAVAQQAMEDHGGSLEIRDPGGEGAWLRAVWPRRPGVA
jgi:signal transduction histidine kinase